MRRGCGAGRRVVVGTANLIAPRLAVVAAEVSEATGADIHVRGVTNTVFGERVNVSGLLSGKDYVEQLANEPKPDLFILPRPSLDYFGEKFLDSMTVTEAEERLGAPLAFAALWSDVVEILERGPERPHRNQATNGAMWSE